ncbi:MAG: ATP synthase F0 subunit C [Planctomycetes bacterium]|nr:ATP synthase F0 subunit C [Planctomycetota bacterium]
MIEFLSDLVSLATDFGDHGLIGIGAGIGAGLICIGAAKGIGELSGAASQGISRQPEAGGQIFQTMIISAALIEGFTFFALYVCLAMTFILETPAAG